MRFPGGSAVKNLPANAGDVSLIPGLGRSPGDGNGKCTPVFLPGKSHGQRSLVDCSSWGHKRVRHDLATKNKRTYIIASVYVKRLMESK